MAISPIQLLKQASPGQRRTLLAAFLGWMLDAFDAMLYALVLTYVMRDLGMSKATSGFLQTLTLLASGIGGLFFGFLADRIGRKRALMSSILTYSICSFFSGLSTTVAMLAVCRFILSLIHIFFARIRLCAKAVPGGSISTLSVLSSNSIRRFL